MEGEIINLRGFNIRVIRINTLIAGSGAAALNAAVSLCSLGQRDIIIATEKWGGGTSNNAGSDKQTYYKLSLSGDKPDSVPDMTRDLFNGKCMHGDIALCEAQGSVRAFMHLVQLGVKFPFDSYGGWAGYKTDHDPRSRGTSAGPYTSAEMFRALSAEVKKLRIRILDRHQIISLLTDKEGTRVIGALAINTRQKDVKNAFVLFNCDNIILGTGGPAGIYDTSVYPESQAGSTGMAFKAGASGQNLTESQFGIASIKFRWNLSGSYQQAMPAYISTDQKGNDRKDFLQEYFPDYEKMLNAIFLKGYQWPFDPRKINGYGSSLIDLAVFNEINEKRRRVFLDYTINPSFNGCSEIQYQRLGQEVFQYLEKSGALSGKPLDRLLELNRPAYMLYIEHGIDLGKELLEIAVCVQHNNGGLKGDIWWESDLKHLFPVGEVNGSHGVYRPGGSALNSGQVGSFRATLKISKKYNNTVIPSDLFFEQSRGQVENELNLALKWLNKGSNRESRKLLSEIRKRMSETVGIIRDLDRVSAALSEAREMNDDLPEQLGIGNTRELSSAFRLMDHCLTHMVYLEAIREYLSKGGRSRGSYLVTDGSPEKIGIHEGMLRGAGLCEYDREIENMILEARYDGHKVSTRMVRPREIPVQDLWFEKVWKEYLEDYSAGC
jgi:succinate dehydrogenase/fumarate reductase flavoprotein subunit